jgi:hypothetical protein
MADRSANILDCLHAESRVSPSLDLAAGLMANLAARQADWLKARLRVMRRGDLMRERPRYSQKLPGRPRAWSEFQV